jgi:hypothetical protein
VALWLLLVCLTVLAALVPMALIHDSLVSAYTGRGRRPLRRELLSVFLYFNVVALAAMLLPAWISLALTLLAWVVTLSTAALAKNPGVQFVWSYRGGQVVWSMSFGRWVACQFTIVTLAVVDLTLTACGDALIGGSTGFQLMPVTSMLGLTLSWMAPGALWSIAGQIFLAWCHDPSRRCPPVLHVGGELTGEQRETVRQCLTSRGWILRLAPKAARPTDVGIVVTEEAVPVREDEAVRWPLHVTLEELTGGMVQDRLSRRDEIQQRRRLISGLERLFKTAARRRYSAGSGFWVAPHLWFISGLSRDTEEEELRFSDGTILSGTIGPPYRRALPLSARRHAFLILRALQVDLIFVEDGSVSADSAVFCA